MKAGDSQQHIHEGVCVRQQIYGTNHDLALGSYTNNRITHTREINGEMLGARIETGEDLPVECDVASETEEGNLKILVLNCQSIVRKWHKLSNIVEIYQPDAVIGVESWLRSDVCDSEVFPKNFKIYRRDRIENSGGGVFIMIREDIISNARVNNDEFEILGVRISLPKHSQLDIIGVYRPGKSDSDLDLIDKLVQYAGTGQERNVFIGGDLNLPGVNWDGNASSRNHDQVMANRMIWESGMIQVVSEPTRGNNTLDVVLIKPNELWKQTSVLDGICDHKLLLVDLSIRAEKKLNKRERVVKQYHMVDQVALNEFLQLNFQQWVSGSNDIDSLWEGFKNVIQKCEMEFVPSKRIKTSDPPYYNREIRRLKKKCREEHNKIRRGKGNREHFRDLNKRLLEAKKTAQNNMLGNLVHSHKSNHDKENDMHRYLRGKRRDLGNSRALKNENGELLLEDREKAEYFSLKFKETVGIKDPEVKSDSIGNGRKASIFRYSSEDIYKKILNLKHGKAPGIDQVTADFIKAAGVGIVPYLRYIFDYCLENQVIPDEWKMAVITPVYKGNGSKCSVDSYRPISLTCIICKIWESILSDYIRNVCDTNNYFDKRQFGFRKGHSCEAQLVGLQQDIAEVLDSGGQLDGIAIDLSKAFDRVDHERLMLKLKNVGLDERVSGWVEKFLKGRSQLVRIGQDLSSPVQIERGVPQGSILGPLLFLIYINDLGLGVVSKIRLFADDVFVYREIKTREDGPILQSDLNKIQDWAKANGMVISGVKSQVISFTNKLFPIISEYVLEDTVVPQANDCKYLGVKFDRSLHWGPHIGVIVNKAYRSLHMIMSV